MKIEITKAERTMIVAALMGEVRVCEKLGLREEASNLRKLILRLALQDAANDGPEVQILRHERIIPSLF